MQGSTEQKAGQKIKLWTWLVAAGVAWTAGFVYNVHLGGEPRWLKDLYQKKAVAAEAIEEPKLLVTGGSGAHYTINSEIIAEAIERPVVNLGIDGPVGLDVILPTALQHVDPGDIVLLVPEYLILLDEDGLGERSGPFAIATGQGLNQVPPKQLVRDWIGIGVPSLRALVKSTSDLIQLGKFSGYYDDPLTVAGDPTVDKQRQGDWWQLSIRQSVTAHSIKRIEQFRSEVEAQGGELILSLPWVYGDNTDTTKANIRKTAEDLEDIAPLLYDAETLNIQSDVTIFADTHYHLTTEGRVVRSQQLAQQLQEILLP
ncbi:hypothetical protein [Leptothoe spongobia]|uniref:Uncharacterized protein n=1 Tax=Leptothoe spongobia TAU-MAC 1115 TaxID=1967444 RepID=A0A947GJY7_9CYAN|nr:hypothetical protein [Leptothoe spongobia]MBT9316393.1 hypothetical protein [Leptothoe spongobia TAU-MAC 1115]